MVGGAIAKALTSSEEWAATCVARRTAEALENADAVAVDLLDSAACERIAAKIEPITHLYFAAYQARPTRVEEIEPNLTLLKYAVLLGRGGGALQRVVLTTDGKDYGVRWAAIKTPARETDPRALTPNFYFDQQDSPLCHRLL